MAVPFYLANPETQRRAVIDPAGALCIYDASRPPFSEVAVNQPMRIFRQHLTDDGLPIDGSNQAMDVNGSSANVDFYIQASQTKDRYISMLSFVIADASQTLNEFANTGSALTNGCRLFYEDAMGEVDIHEALTTNFEFIRLCGGMPAFGDAAGAFLANNVTGTSEGYIPMLDLRRTFGFQWGIRLAKGTNQKVVMRIRDNCTAADQFDCIAYGFEME